MCPNADDPVFVRSVALIRSKFGALDDLPSEFAQVVWVTVFRACAIGLQVETAGGHLALMKNMLAGDGQDGLNLEKATLRLKFLQDMIPHIRMANSKDKELDSQLAIDILKWGIIDAADMSAVERALARKLAKADPLYEQPVPKDVL